MGRIKGCTNEKCIAYKKKTKYKESDEYCTKCGNELSYVCNKCHIPLENATEKYCVRCLAEKKDRNDNAKKKVGGIGGTVLGAGLLVLAKGKDIIKYIPK